MSTGMIDIDKTRVFAANPLTVMQVSITIGLLLAGILLIVLSRDGSPDGAQALVLGSLLIFGALARIGYTFLPQVEPEQADHRTFIRRYPLPDQAGQGIAHSME